MILRIRGLGSKLFTETLLEFCYDTGSPHCQEVYAMLHGLELCPAHGRTSSAWH